MSKLVTVILINLTSLILFAQSEDPNLSGGVDESIEQLESEILSYLEPYIYDVEGRRDPFQPFKIFVEEPSMEDQFQEDTPLKNEIEQPTLPLLRYNLSQLSLKAILWNVKNPKVIVEDPNKKQHILSKRDRIGNNGGYIATIREGEIVVVQKINVQGKEIVSTKYMRLKR